MEMEIVYTLSGRYMYLNVFSVPFSSSINDIAKTEVSILCGNVTEAFLADLLDGGQRILLPYEIAEKILNALNTGCTVYINAGRYQAEILPF